MMNKRKVTAIMISATLASVTLAGNVMAQNEYPTIDFNNTTVYGDVGPDGSVPGGLEDVQLTDEEIQKVKDGNFKVAICYHQLDNQVNQSKLSACQEVLEELGIDYEMTIISAHRMPDVFFDWAKAAEGKGIKVIIAGAGMAAHLPGMCAALFPMPVIGIPMSGKNLEGMDALYSIVQMPPGIPVATVAIDGGMNAAILAAKMLAMSDPELLEKLKAYSAEMKETVQAKADRLAKVGYEEYLKEK